MLFACLIKHDLYPNKLEIQILLCPLVCLMYLCFLLSAATAMVEGKIGKSLKKVLKKVVAKEAHEQLAISDLKLGGVIKVRKQTKYNTVSIDLKIMCNTVR